MMRRSCPGRPETSNNISRKSMFVVSRDTFEIKIGRGFELTAIIAFNTLFRFQGT